MKHCVAVATTRWPCPRAISTTLSRAKSSTSLVSLPTSCTAICGSVAASQLLQDYKVVQRAAVQQE
eukprot:5292-Heterococcus_DN1.PRE.3